MNIPFKVIKRGLTNYKGVRRRFEIKGTFNDIMVVDIIHTSTGLLQH